MDYLTFSVKLCEALAWPTVALITLLLLQKPIGEFIAAWETLKGKYKDIELEFKRTLAVAKEKAEDASLPSASESTTTTTPAPGGSFSSEPAIDRYTKLIDVSPRAGIIEAWTDIEMALTRVASTCGIPPAWSSAQLISALTDRGCLNRRTESLLDELRTLRNEVAHGRNLPISKEDAIDYALIAVRVLARLRGLAA
jgi:hypothetical protein